MKPKKYAFAKMFIIYVTFFLGLCSWAYFAFDSGVEQGFWGPREVKVFNSSKALKALPVLIGVWIFYPIIGGLVVKACEVLRKWAYMTEEGYSARQRIWLAAVWPVTLIYSLIAYSFLGFIHRLF